ncbi:MAG: efflux transporter periplasmic adaptor subunit, partial [Pirellulaceae bacterium]
MKPAMQRSSSLQFRSRSGRSTQTAPSRSGSILWLVLLLIGILGSSGYAYWRYREAKATSPSNQPVMQAVMRGPFDHIVLEQGEIESSSNVEVKCEVKGKGTSGTPILWVIDEGTYVKNGEELVKLDSSQLENDLKSQRITLSAAEALVISSEAAVKQAMIARQEYLEGTYLTERKAILSEIAVAEQDLRKAELSLASAERLAAKGTLKS